MSGGIKLIRWAIFAGVNVLNDGTCHLGVGDLEHSVSNIKIADLVQCCSGDVKQNMSQD